MHVGHVSGGQVHWQRKNSLSKFPVIKSRLSFGACSHHGQPQGTNALQRAAYCCIPLRAQVGAPLVCVVCERLRHTDR